MIELSNIAGAVKSHELAGIPVNQSEDCQEDKETSPTKSKPLESCQNMSCDSALSIGTGQPVQQL
jgi:hypothetical protein